MVCLQTNGKYVDISGKLLNRVLEFKEYLRS